MRSQRKDGSDAERSEGQTQRPANTGKEQTLCYQLPNDAYVTRSKRTPYCNFLSADRASCEQQVCDIRTSDQQDEEDRSRDNGEHKRNGFAVDLCR